MVSSFNNQLSTNWANIKQSASGRWTLSIGQADICNSERIRILVFDFEFQFGNDDILLSVAVVYHSISNSTRSL